MRSFAKDYQLGTTAEKQLLPILNELFNTTFQPTQKYDPFDFTSPTLNLELKTRTNKYKQYPTTMLPNSKIVHAELSGKPTVFVFNFTDGVYYIHYDSTLFSTFTTNEFQRADRQDHTDRAQSYIYIPIQSLLRLNSNAKPVDPEP